MKCPICKNTVGFACCMCIKCGFNRMDNTYHFIEVSTDLLERLVSHEVFECLVAEHEKRKKN